MASGEKLKVLLIEDHPPDVRMIELCLPPDEFSLTSSERLAAALDRLRNESFDLLLSDLSLPDSSGIETVRRLLAVEPALPLVVMTGLDDQEIARLALQEGAQDYLVKEHNNELLLPRALRYARERHLNHLALQVQKEQHRRAANRFKTLFDGIPDSLVLLDKELKILYANQGVEDLFGDEATSGRIVGRSCKEIFCRIKGPCPRCLAAACVTSGNTEQDKTTLEDGRVVELRVFPLKNSDNEVEQVIKMATDITDSERLRSKAVRTGQLAALGEMAAGVAHEINNPINGIINYATILSHKITDDKLADMADRIIHEGERIAGIVSKLLSFTREKSEPAKPFSLIEVCHTSLALFSSQLRHDGIVIEIDLPDDLPLAFGRPQQIEQVVTNLVSNARYALNSKFPEPEPGKKLQLSARAKTAGTLELVCLDHGCGIPETIQGKIFSPFFSTKPPDKGSGLGLGISLEIVQNHGGTLTINSVEGEFTEIRLELPQAPAAL